MDKLETAWATPDWGFEKGSVSSWSGKGVWLCHDALRKHFPFDYNEHTRVRLVMTCKKSVGALHIAGCNEDGNTIYLNDRKGTTIWCDESVGAFVDEAMEWGLVWMQLEVQ